MKKLLFLLILFCGCDQHSKMTDAEYAKHLAENKLREATTEELEKCLADEMIAKTYAAERIKDSLKLKSTVRRPAVSLNYNVDEDIALFHAKREYEKMYTLFWQEHPKCEIKLCNAGCETVWKSKDKPSPGRSEGLAFIDFESKEEITIVGSFVIRTIVYEDMPKPPAEYKWTVGILNDYMYGSRSRVY